MRVVLSSDVEHLGKFGQEVSVRAGYARNFLLPRGLALLSTKTNRAALDHRIKLLEKERAVALDAARSVAGQIEKISVTVGKQVGEDERIFGTVTTSELEALLAQEGVQVSKKQIEIVDEIKKVGVYSARVKIHPEVEARFKVWVVAQ